MKCLSFSIFDRRIKKWPEPGGGRCLWLNEQLVSYCVVSLSLFES